MENILAYIVALIHVIYLGGLLILTIYAIFDAGFIVGLVLMMTGFSFGYPLLQAILPLHLPED